MKTLKSQQAHPLNPLLNWLHDLVRKSKDALPANTRLKALEGIVWLTLHTDPASLHNLHHTLEQQLVENTLPPALLAGMFTTQHNTTQHNTTQHNTTQRNTTNYYLV